VWRLALAGTPVWPPALAGRPVWPPALAGRPVWPPAAGRPARVRMPTPVLARGLIPARTPVPVPVPVLVLVLVLVPVLVPVLVLAWRRTRSGTRIPATSAARAGSGT
jgi:hypothetical protein